MLTKADKILIALSTAFAVVLFGVFLWMGGDSPQTIIVEVDGKVFGRYAIDANQKIEINKDGHLNIALVEDGTVRMAAADCPDGLCVKQGIISSASQAIVCLPNKVMILIQGQGEADVVAQ